MKSTDDINLVISRPNKFSYSETFIDAHVRLLKGKKNVLYGGNFPVYYGLDKFIISNKLALAWYLFAKRVLKQKEIGVRTQALSNFFRANKTDVVLAQYGVTGALIRQACQQAGVPMVIHFHGFDATTNEILAEYKELYSKAFEYASFIVAVSEIMVSQLITLGAPISKTILVNYGVDLNQFVPASGALNELIFLSVGRFVEKKSPLTTIQAFSEVVGSFPEARLIMVGRGPLLEAAKTLAKRLKVESSIDFEGERTPHEVRGYLKRASVFVLHSVKAPSGDCEGTPVAILEAAASALPVISTRHAGIPQAVLHGQSGFLTAEHDVAETASFMKLLAANVELRRQMGQAGRAHISVHYNQEKQVKKLDDLIYRAYRKWA